MNKNDNLKIRKYRVPLQKSLNPIPRTNCTSSHENCAIPLRPSSRFSKHQVFLFLFTDSVPSLCIISEKLPQRILRTKHTSFWAQNGGKNNPLCDQYKFVSRYSSVPLLFTFNISSSSKISENSLEKIRRINAYEF